MFDIDALIQAKKEIDKNSKDNKVEEKKNEDNGYIDFLNKINS